MATNTNKIRDNLLVLEESERLWLASNAVDAHEVDGDVLLNIEFVGYIAGPAFKKADVKPQIKTLRIRACGPEILRLTFHPDRVNEEESPMLMSSLPEQTSLKIDRSTDTWTIMDEEGHRRACINTTPIPLQPWSDLLPPTEKQLEIELFPDGKTSVPLMAYDQFAHGLIESVPLGFIERDGAVSDTVFSFHAEPSEKYAGTGERFCEMNLSGQTLQLVNEDGSGVNSQRAYKNVPFYLSSRPYGLFVHTSSRVDLSLASISTRVAQGRVAEADLDLFVIGGGSTERILYNYRCLTGFPPEVPLWSYGVWMSRMTYYSAEEVSGIGDRMRKDGYPCDVLHVDTGWFEKDWVCEWKFSEEKFPNHPAYIANLLEKGFRMSLWQTPNISRECCLSTEAIDNAYIPSLSADTKMESDFSGQHIIGQIDFSNPEAVKWYQESLLRPLLEAGVAAIKTDFGEEINMDAEYCSLPASKLRNRYALLYQKAAFEITEDVYGKGNALIWARSGWAGAQRYPVHWGGDAASTWDGMAGSLKGGLHLGVSGFAYWSHDIPGFHSVPDFMNSRIEPELYLRWTQMGVFSSHMRYHGTMPREPWEFPEVADAVKSWLNLRYALIPYIVEQAKASIKTGMPLMSAMFLQHEDDPTCWQISDQYYFGESFLVAPVMNKRGVRHVYLPEGEWVNFWTGELIKGERWLKKIKVPLDHMPVYVRKGAVIPFYCELVSSTCKMDMEKVVMIEINEGFQGLPTCQELWRR